MERTNKILHDVHFVASSFRGSLILRVLAVYSESFFWVNLFIGFKAGASFCFILQCYLCRVYYR